MKRPPRSVKEGESEHRALKMKVFFLFLLLWGGPAVLGDPGVIHVGEEGGNLTHKCSFVFGGPNRFFCRNECVGEDTLVYTSNDTAQYERYSVEYKPSFLSPVLYVSITNLMKSDSGWYRCGIDRSFIPDSEQDFEIRVENAPVTPKPDWALPTSSPSDQATSSSSGSPTSPPSPGSSDQSGLEGTTKGPGVLLFVSLTLGIVVIMLSVTVFIFFRRRAGKLKEHREEMEDPNTEKELDIPMYAEIAMEPRRGGTPPPQISTVYSCVKIH